MSENILMISESNDGLLKAKNKDYVILVLFSTTLSKLDHRVVLIIRYRCQNCESVEKYFAEVHKAYYSSPLSNNTKILFAIARIEDAQDYFIIVVSLFLAFM